MALRSSQHETNAIQFNFQAAKSLCKAEKKKEKAVWSATAENKQRRNGAVPSSPGAHFSVAVEALSFTLYVFTLHFYPPHPFFSCALEKRCRSPVAKHVEKETFQAKNAKKERNMIIASAMK